mmetsp:Transcript_41527/g.111286  ORF Transcript_41527/g.111286 Transcript_41527/m.111286 type:complete len:238 (+) Transcript_41527:5659-6372(+)
MRGGVLGPASAGDGGRAARREDREGGAAAGIRAAHDAGAVTAGFGRRPSLGRRTHPRGRGAAPRAARRGRLPLVARPDPARQALRAGARGARGHAAPSLHAGPAPLHHPVQPLWAHVQVYARGRRQGVGALPRLRLVPLEGPGAAPSSRADGLPRPHPGGPPRGAVAVPGRGSVARVLEYVLRQGGGLLLHGRGRRWCGVVQDPCAKLPGHLRVLVSAARAGASAAAHASLRRGRGL